MPNHALLINPQADGSLPAEGRASESHTGRCPFTRPRVACGSEPS
jgi:hypothetical protein